MIITLLLIDKLIISYLVYTKESQIYYLKLSKLMKELHIGKEVWTYKGLNFGLVDINENIINDELVRIVSG
jgi:hypothetical protein